MTNDFFGLLIDAIQQLVTQNIGVFVGTGQRMFAGFAIILIAWFGIQTALASAEGSGGPNFSGFARLMMLIAFGYAITSGYNTPIPGIGYSFVSLVTEETNYLSAQIGQATAQTLVTTVTDTMKNLPPPLVWLNVLYVLVYLLILLALALVAALTFVVIAFGTVAQGVLVLVGPIFVPFFIVPKLDWLFWGWFRCFLQYSFYRVIANAYIFVFGKVLLGFLTANGGNLGPAEWLALLPSFVIYVLTFIYGIVKIPTLTSHLFSGSSGADSGLLQSGVGFVTGAASKAVTVAAAG